MSGQPQLSQGNEAYDTDVFKSQQERQSVYDNLRTSQHMDKVQYFGISENRSASTLYHPTQVISIPKASRFNYKNKEAHNAKAKNITLPTTLNRRACSFGFGYKNSQDIVIQERKAVPGPEQYSRYQKVLHPAQAKTFGVSYEAYRRVHIPGVYLNGMTDNLNPGVGKYEISKDFASDKLKYSMQGRTFSQPRLEREKRPDPGQYTINDKNNQITRYSGTSFGYGQKKLDMGATFTPGPGAYDSNKSQFEKFRKKPFHRQNIYQNNIAMQFSERKQKLEEPI